MQSDQQSEDMKRQLEIEEQKWKEQVSALKREVEEKNIVIKRLEIKAKADMEQVYSPHECLIQRNDLIVFMGKELNCDRTFNICSCRSDN